MYVSDLQSQLPPHLVAQQDGLNWLSRAHARHSTEIDAERFAKLLSRYGCGPDKITRRGTFLGDFTHLDWERMQIFSGRPVAIDHLMAFYNESLLPAVDRLYADRTPEFNQWIHVTCTGYLSPSVIQILCSKRGWEKQECMHAYHMGCYAALPALRMARGNGECEILHTELCTLHLNPADHDPEQLVIQSLFADGVIRYKAGDALPARGFRVEELCERIAPATLGHMTWNVGAERFKMTLSREVPKAVQSAVAGVIKPWRSSKAVYAVHPGGPRIIDAVKEALELSEEQLHFSREVLRMHGNMSSATLPHVWEKMLAEIPPGTPVISMAFGPGLTLSASLMTKVES